MRLFNDGCVRGFAGIAAVLVALSAGTSYAAGGAGGGDLIKLDSGEVLAGKILEETADSVKFEHPVLGVLTLSKGRVSVLQNLTSKVAAEQRAKAEAEAKAKAAEAAKAAGFKPEPESFFEGWKGRIEGGLAGSSGNSEQLALRFVLGLARKTATMETAAGASYIYATSDGDKSKSRGEGFIRNDWLFKDSPWGFFALGRVEYDEFQSWLWRLSAYAGPSYTLINNDRTLLRLRAGAGLQKELGRDNRNEIIPEALFGADFTHKLDDRSSLFANVDYLPSLRNFSEYRVVAKGGYEFIVDPKTNMSLKLGVEDRYNSEPGSGRKKNDVDYFLTVGWEF